MKLNYYLNEATRPLSKYSKGQVELDSADSAYLGTETRKIKEILTKADRIHLWEGKKALEEFATALDDVTNLSKGLAKTSRTYAKGLK